MISPLCCLFSLFVTHTHTHTRTHTLSHTHTHPLSDTQILSFSHTHTLSFSLSLSLSQDRMVEARPRALRTVRKVEVEVVVSVVEGLVREEGDCTGL